MMESRPNRLFALPVASAEVPVSHGKDAVEDSGAGLGPQGGRDAGFIVAKYFRQAAGWQWWVAAILAVPTLPILAMAMLLVKCTSRGPALYHQTRVGLNGSHFKVIKVRTMRLDAEAGTGAVWTTSLKDPRITWVGAILRLTHIDELPQLWNVLRGDMALVGPRPERPEFTGMLAESIPGYLNRLRVLPGVTGLAQVNLPADTDVNSVHKKLQLDLRYMEEGSLSLDLRIILCTAARLLCIRSKYLRQLLGVDCEPTDGDFVSPERFSARDVSSLKPGQPLARCVAATELKRALKSPRPENDWEGVCFSETQPTSGVVRQ